jgi:hypothetical protein
MTTVREPLRCGDCGVIEGQLHIKGCDMEHCARCGCQSISCDCDVSESERIPYIEYPSMCAKCGKLHPDMFMVPKEEWEFYIEARHRDDVICPECYATIREWINARSGRQVPPNADVWAAVNIGRRRLDEIIKWHLNGNSTHGGIKDG